MAFVESLIVIFLQALVLYDSKEQDEDHENEHWLMYMMKGKLKAKRNELIVDCLKEYVSSMEKLLEQGATVPKKVSFNNPPDYALEFIEVYYRFNACIIKEEVSR